MPIDSWVSTQLFEYSHIDNHVVAKVFVSRNESVSILVFKAHALRSGRSRVQTIEVFDGCDNGVSRIMRVDLHSHRQARTILRCFEEQKLECDVLGRHLPRGDSLGPWGSVGCTDNATRR